MTHRESPHCSLESGAVSFESTFHEIRVCGAPGMGPQEFRTHVMPSPQARALRRHTTSIEVETRMSPRIEPRTQGQISRIEARKRAIVNMAASIDESLRRAPISDFEPRCNSPLSLGPPRCQIAPAMMEG